MEFEIKEISKDLDFAYVRYSVREFIPQLMRCFKYQEYGHIAKYCTGKRRCARCDREYGKCGNGVLPKCFHSSGEHGMAYWGYVR